MEGIFPPGASFRVTPFHIFLTKISLRKVCLFHLLWVMEEKIRVPYVNSIFAPKSQLSKYTNWAEIIWLQEQGIKCEWRKGHEVGVRHPGCLPFSCVTLGCGFLFSPLKTEAGENNFQDPLCSQDPVRILGARARNGMRESASPGYRDTCACFPVKGVSRLTLGEDGWSFSRKECLQNL